MFDNLEDHFPFDWLVKHFQKENIVDIFNRYSRNCLFPTLLFYKRVKIPCWLYICVSGQLLPKMPWKKNWNQKESAWTLGWSFVPNTRLALPLFKIARLIVWWGYGGVSVYIEIDIIFIFLQKIFNSLNSIAENLIIALTIGKTMSICEIYFSQIGFYLAHFHEEILWKFQTIPGLCPGPAGGLTVPNNPPVNYSNCCTTVFSR